MTARTIQGTVYVLGGNVDTDQIIPAKHLVYKMDDPAERRLYGRFCLSGVPGAQAGLPGGNIPFVKQGKDVSDFSIIVAGPNFGCGSSREHAPFALHVAGIRAVVAGSYARIFYRNAVDGGFFIPFESEQNLSLIFRTGDDATIDAGRTEIRNQTIGKVFALRPLGYAADIVYAGGLFAYARTHGMIKSPNPEVGESTRSQR